MLCASDLVHLGAQLHVGGNLFSVELREDLKGWLEIVRLLAQACKQT